MDNTSKLGLGFILPKRTFLILRYHWRWSNYLSYLRCTIMKVYTKCPFIVPTCKLQVYMYPPLIVDLPLLRQTKLSSCFNWERVLTVFCPFKDKLRSVLMDSLNRQTTTPPHDIMIQRSVKCCIFSQVFSLTVDNRMFGNWSLSTEYPFVCPEPTFCIWSWPFLTTANNVVSARWPKIIWAAFIRKVRLYHRNLDLWTEEEYAKLEEEIICWSSTHHSSVHNFRFLWFCRQFQWTVLSVQCPVH